MRADPISEEENMSEYSINAAAMSAFGQGLNPTAHNLANINTQDFRAWSRVYSEGRPGQGPRAVTRSGEDAFGARDRVSLSFLDPSDPEAALRQISENGLPPEAMSGNTVDLARETVNLITDQRAFEANAAVISTRQTLDDAMLGLVADRRV